MAEVVEILSVDEIIAGAVQTFLKDPVAVEAKMAARTTEYDELRNDRRESWKRMYRRPPRLSRFRFRLRLKRLRAHTGLAASGPVLRSVECTAVHSSSRPR